MVTEMTIFSPLFHFIHVDSSHAITFLEGTSLLKEISEKQNIPLPQIQSLKSFILPSFTLLSLVKNHESYGIYVDPYDRDFSIKLEVHADGSFRGLLKLPSTFNSNAPINATCRYIKYQPHENNPYTSILELKNQTLDIFVPSLLKNSFQTNSIIHSPTDSSSSLILSAFPGEKINFDLILENESLISNFKLAEQLDNRKVNNEEFHKFVMKVESMGYKFLTLKKLFYKCSCSEEKIILTLKSLANQSPSDLFEEGEEKINISCDYCGKTYSLEKHQLQLQ